MVASVEACNCIMHMFLEKLIQWVTFRHLHFNYAYYLNYTPDVVNVHHMISIWVSILTPLPLRVLVRLCAFHMHTTLLLLLECSLIKLYAVSCNNNGVHICEPLKVFWQLLKLCCRILVRTAVGYTQSSLIGCGGDRSLSIQTKSGFLPSHEAIYLHFPSQLTLAEVTTCKSLVCTVYLL